MGYKKLGHWQLGSALALICVLIAAIAIGQETTANQASQAAQEMQSPQAAPTGGRAAATRTFLGLGAEPDKAAAARGAPLYQQSCAFCHGPQARGATGASLITADEVLGDDHGEHLIPFLKRGRPEKGMPAFATMTDDQLRDIAEFVHLQVEEVANRGTYEVRNILTGNRALGRAYVEAFCVKCHDTSAFAHFGSKFRSPEKLQKEWIWPSRTATNGLALAGTVKTSSGDTITGRVTQISDFRITLVDAAGQTHSIDRVPGVEVTTKDPLSAHEDMIQTLANDDMHNVTAYLESLQ